MKICNRKILTLIFVSVIYLCGYSQTKFNYSLKEHPVYYEDPAVKEWATSCRIVRGYIRIDNKEMGRASAGEENVCLGKADNKTVSLGDSGIAVVSFSEPVKNIAGYDFAVFENSFDGKFLELGFVEVSSDSIKWVRFPSKSFTPSTVQTGTFGLTDPDNIYNLAGKYRVLYGTPFDLEELKDSAGIDLNNVRYIKIVDVIGCIDDSYASYDAMGNKINDPWPTPFPQSGFDLDAVAVMKQVTGINSPETEEQIRIYPNPSSGRIIIDVPSDDGYNVFISDNAGRVLKEWHIDGSGDSLEVDDLKPGIYFVRLAGNRIGFVSRIVIF